MTDKLVEKCLLTPEEMKEAWLKACRENTTLDMLNYPQVITKDQLIKAIPIIAEEIKRELELESYGDPRVTDWVKISYSDWHTFWEKYKGGK
ncbi:hypothetical protein LCGC14_0406260 [marine sediment metagenome]|uniref:Uncharacterized protein n=1 Tax=marine sediment metagenome TaxID=412755 RepID=A0A0F9TDF9_9ZZZZ